MQISEIDYVDLPSRVPDYSGLNVPAAKFALVDFMDPYNKLNLDVELVDPTRGVTLSLPFSTYGTKFFEDNGRTRMEMGAFKFRRTATTLTNATNIKVRIQGGLRVHCACR